MSNKPAPEWLLKILTEYGRYTNGVERQDAVLHGMTRQVAANAIQQRFEAAIGKDDPRPASGPQRSGTAQAVRRARNNLRVQQRQAWEENHE